MKYMFHYALNFNQPLNKWNTSNVKNMHAMFNHAKSFNKNNAQWCQFYGN